MNGQAGNASARATAAAVARRSHGKLVAFLAARTRDVAAAEDALSEAFATALVEWPRTGSPSNPEAWLLTVARRKLIDGARHRRAGEAAVPEWLRVAGSEDAATDAEIPDQRLALLFACAHPAIEVGIRAPLMLQVVLGLDAKRIASAFLTSPAAMGKRLVRAKDKIRQAGIPFRIPEREELAGRLGAVLDAIYAAFTDGWTDPAGTDSARRGLTLEAIFLARVVADLLPGEAEALGLLACLLHAQARSAARRDADGDYVPLAAQDIAAWDAEMADEAEALLHRASTLRTVGRYQLEAALQSAHVERRRLGRANGRAVLQIHDALAALTGSPVVAINRALAVADVHGARAALAAMPDIRVDARLAAYQPYWAVRAELLTRIGAHGDAHTAYDVAIGLEADPAVRRFLQRRQAAWRSAAELRSPAPSHGSALASGRAPDQHVGTQEVAHMTDHDDRIEKRVLLDAPLERAWHAISDARQFGIWFGVEFDAPFVAGTHATGRIVPTRVDAEVARMQEPYTGTAFDIHVDRIEPMQRFSFRWHPFAIEAGVDYSKEPATEVVFELEAADSGTLLTITESGFERLPAARRACAFAANERGWQEQVKLIGKFLALA